MRFVQPAAFFYLRQLAAIILTTMMSSSTANTTIDACANCNKAESDNVKLKRCMACQMVRHCSRDCQVAHRPKHKKACKKRAAEIFDEELFKNPPEREECPICLLPLPLHGERIVFQPCCGKTLCVGCIHTQRKKDPFVRCAFCRTPGATTDRELIDRMNKGRDRNDGESTYQLGLCYKDGSTGLQKDSAKALELFLEAGKHGCADAYYAVGNFYYDGLGVEKDMKRAKYYWELGAVGGTIFARYSLGWFEVKSGNYERANKHFFIGAKAGDEVSLKAMEKGIEFGHVTKEKYAEALRLYQKQHEDTRSAMRDEAVVYMANPSMYLNNS